MYFFKKSNPATNICDGVFWLGQDARVSELVVLGEALALFRLEGQIHGRFALVEAELHHRGRVVRLVGFDPRDGELARLDVPGLVVYGCRDLPASGEEVGGHLGGVAALGYVTHEKRGNLDLLLEHVCLEPRGVGLGLLQRFATRSSALLCLGGATNGVVLIGGAVGNGASSHDGLLQVRPLVFPAVINTY